MEMASPANEKESVMSEIAIKENIIGGAQLCAMCGALMVSRPGPDLYLIMEGTMQVVCRDCGREQAPHLVTLIELGERAA